MRGLQIILVLLLFIGSNVLYANDSLQLTQQIDTLIVQIDSLQNAENLLVRETTISTSYFNKVLTHRHLPSVSIILLLLGLIFWPFSKRQAEYSEHHVTQG